MPDGIHGSLLPVSESQKGLLITDRWLPRPEVYNQMVQLDVVPTTSYEEAKRALSALVTAQPALRQVFRLTPEMAVWLAEPPTPASLDVERVEVSAAEFESATAALVQRLAERPIDLAVGPAYRFGHVRTTDGVTAARIVMCLHHVVFDGMSLGPLARDLDAALSGVDIGARRAAREEAFGRELSAQVRAGAPERVAERVKPWAERLRLVPPLDLAHRPHAPSPPGWRGGRSTWLLDDRTATMLDDTCRALAITPFVLFTGIFGAVVARHGGVSTVLVGSPIGARRTVGAFDLCGFFVNTLPITVDVAWESRVDRYLTESVRSAVDFCRASADVSFNQLVAVVQPDRIDSRNPLFSCVLAMQDTHDGQFDATVTGVSEPANGGAKFDLWLGATRTGGTWLIELEYDVAIISATVGDGILGSLRTALCGALEDQARSVADLFVDHPVAPQPAYPLRYRTVYDSVEAAARRTPDAVAVEEDDRQLTYRELMAAAERIAGGLVCLGVNPGDTVAVATEQLGDTISVIMGVLRCGATFVPLDPVLPVERLATMARLAECRLAVGETIELPGLRTVAPGSLVGGEGSATTSSPPPLPVYAMFTSGSTGVPKGVLMGQRPLMNLAAWQIVHLRHDARTRFFQYAPLTFDVFYQEMLPPLMAGGTVVARQPVDRRDFPALVRRVAKTRVTHLFLPAAALRPFVVSALRAGTALPDLRQVCVSGEQLVVDDNIRRFFAELADCTLVNLYGPTETNAVTAHELAGDTRRWPAHVPIGRPMPGVVPYVVDQAGHLAPPGVPGELFLGGECLADGYLNAPERTAAAFLPDRFGADPGARMYRTGDLVARDEDGLLVYLGRRDNQVKIRGHRVELGEIETVANRVAGVREAVAIARRAGSDLELVLFVRPEEDRQVDHAAVRTHIAAALPAYMSPAWIFDLARVPTSATGKTDRTALAAQADIQIAAAVAATPTTAAPRYLDDTERALADLWADILEISTVSPEASLVELGAHSLKVFAAVAEIEQRFGWSVDIADFFRNPTVAALAESIRAEAHNSPADR
ncbi:non-ribosomal peptide synthetase [Micromonospora sp. CA-259024]|uniref:non-ribosomal peptide synthetase n=1 Tax=Micromonospora sp. CA-259024 TaxID=3239965 RepID=UPI003D8A9242